MKLKMHGLNPLMITSIASLILALGKLSGFVLTGSMIVLASCIDSFLDSIVSFINYRMQKFARSHADTEHPFGHGGFEVVGSLLQGMLIGAGGVIIIIQSLSSLLFDHDYTPIDNEFAFFYAASVLGVGALSGLLIHFFLSHHKNKLTNEGKRSLALNADHAHYFVDFSTNIAGILGLLATYYFGSMIFDGILGILSGILVLATGLPIIRDCISDIVHTQVPTKDQQQIVEVALKAHPEILGVHRLRTRKLGPATFADFHLKLRHNIRLDDAHLIGEQVADELKKHIPGLDVLIHIDPDNEPDDDVFPPSYT